MYLHLNFLGYTMTCRPSQVLQTSFSVVNAAVGDMAGMGGMGGMAGMGGMG